MIFNNHLSKASYKELVLHTLALKIKCLSLKSIAFMLLVSHES